MTESTGMEPADIELLCPECDYNLTGASGPRCPWCGAHIDYDAIIAQATAPPSVLRVGCVVASLMVGLGTIFIVVALTRHQGVRRITEGIALLGGIVAAAGLLWIALLGIRPTNRWPIRNAGARSLIRLAGWISVIAGMIGAANMLDVGLDPKLVRGVAVYGGFEYVLGAIAFTFPGWVLLLLRHVSFRPDPIAGRSGDADPGADDACPFDVMFARRYTKGQVVVRSSSVRRATTSQIEAHITRQWDAERAVAEQTGQTLFNGALGRLVSVRPGDPGAPGLELHVGATTYKEFLGTNVHPDSSMRRIRPADLDRPSKERDTDLDSERSPVENRCHTSPAENQCHTPPVGNRCHTSPAENRCHTSPVGNRCHTSRASSQCHTSLDDHLANPLGISATIITADGKLVLGRRSQQVSLHRGYLHTFGGMLEEPDRSPDGSYGVFDCAIRELCEELPLKPEEIGDLVIIGLVKDRGLRQPELLFDARITIPLVDLKDRFESASLDFEHVAIEWTPDEPSLLPPFILGARPVAPVAQAAILLHGRQRWGTDWFETACRSCYGAVPAIAGGVSDVSEAQP